MWLLREIECEITLGVYYPVLSLETSTGNNPSSESWHTKIQARLDDWYQKIRQSVSLMEKIEFHELLFQIQVLRLNRPSPRCPVPNNEMRKRALKASIALIKEFSVLDRLGKMFMLWHAAHCVLEGGVSLLSTVLTAIESKSPARPHICGEDASILTKYIKTCLSLMWKISRRWPSVQPYASMLDSISVSVLDNLQHWSEGKDVLSSDLLSLKGKLRQLTVFAPTSSEEAALPNISPQSTAVSHYQAFDTSSNLSGQSQTMFDSSTFQLPVIGQTEPMNTNWPNGQPGLDRSFSILPGTYTLDYSDPMAIDFSGIDSEEIFAALLDGWQSESLMLA